MYQKNDYIVVTHPDYPELQGLAQIKHNVVSKIANIEFCDGRGSFIAHTEFIRKATEMEIKNVLINKQN